MAKLHFKAGVATNLEKLVGLCDKNRDEAKAHLYRQNLPFQTFLQDLSLETGKEWYAELAGRVRTIVKENQEDRDVGLEKFLQATGLVKEPKPEVKPAELTFDRLQNLLQQKIKISNRGRGHLFGTVKPGPNLEVRPPKFSGNDVEIEVTLKEDATESGRESEVIIETPVQTPVGQDCRRFKIRVSFAPEVVVPRRDIEVYAKKLEDYINSSDWNDALAACDEVLKRDPEYARALKVKPQLDKLINDINRLMADGDAALQINNFEGARKAYLDVLEMAPNDSEAKQRLAMVEWREKLVGQAREKLAKQVADRVAALFCGLIVGIASYFWIRTRVAPPALALYCSYVVTLFVAALITGLFFQPFKLQGLVAAVLVPVAHLSLLLGTWVLWQNWISSVAIALVAGHFISRQLVVMCCWEMYQYSSRSEQVV